ncbi:DUF7343 domain-containing protein [Salinilacihabitans rarus]|uniref:DUF7343 domain-containing protein n=1 Tax=Salinilacihabitans rarus TaxID=2961596 RepID=UPI0020C93249|nr:helix-turn-helix domain-containing protein [Salinilacihabitans rarus]
MNRSVLAGVVALFLLVAGASGPVAAVGLGDGQPASAATVTSTDRTAAVSSPEFDSTTFEITVHGNGTAEWTFRHERLLTNETERENFETFADRFEEEETDFYVSFTEQAAALTDAGAQETGREMEATDFERSAGVERRLNTQGVVEMSFTWTGFAEVEDDGRVVVGDVFDGGLYIGADQKLVIVPGDDLVVTSALPEPEYNTASIEDATSITWEGEREFLDGQPRIVLEEPTASPGGDGTGPDGESRSWLLVGGLLAVVAGLGGAFVWFRSRERGDDGSPPEAPAGGAEAADDRAASDPDPISEEELLTDEDRVVELIRENGGRMKQVNIVEETGWSKSKVSMLLSDMEDEGTISKLRVGRENIISLEGFEPEATKSPFDE